MELAELLISAGLGEKEALVYLSLLRYGTRPTSYLAGKTELNRGTAYVTLHSLLAKGLVSKNIRRKVQYFTALDPEHVIEWIERRRAQLAAAGRQVRDAVPQFRQQMSRLASKPTIQFFEGRDGARTALNYTLEADEKILCAFLSLGDMADYLGSDYFENYTNQRISRGYTLHALRTMDKDKIAMSKYFYARAYVTSRAQRREVRYLSDNLAFPLTMYLFDNKTLLLSSREENFAMLIESREYCEMQRKLFLLLWEQAEPRRGRAGKTSD